MTKAEFDARAIQALDEGWTVVPKQNRANNWSRDHYIRGNITVWMPNYSWRRAKLINGIYRDHQTFSTFEEAIHG